MPIKSVLVGTHVCSLLKRQNNISFITFVHAETESQARASLGKTLVSICDTPPKYYKYDPNT